MEVILLVWEQIVDFSATDHGGVQRVRGAAVYGGIFGVSAVEGVFGPFSRSSGRPGVSASFSSPRALTPVSARGLLPISS